MDETNSPSAIPDIIARELNFSVDQVAATAALLEDGATIPFIARYRKEATGSLDELAVAAIRNRLGQLRELDQRRQAILTSLEENGHLTDELRIRVIKAPTLAQLNDIYLPYRPKRRTRATVAREKGLEPLARVIFDQNGVIPEAVAGDFLNPETGVASGEDALAGARDIIAEWINEDAAARNTMRDFFLKRATLKSRVAKGKEKEGQKYRDYFDWEEPAAKAPSHRVLAIRRGERDRCAEHDRSAPGIRSPGSVNAAFCHGKRPGFTASRVGAAGQLPTVVIPLHGNGDSAIHQRTGRCGGHRHIRNKPERAAHRSAAGTQTDWL